MLGWLRLFVRSRVERSLFLDADEFAATLTCERSRANRAGTCFALLTLSSSTSQLQSADLHAFSEIFRQRRRATDLAGRTPDGRIGIVLPDTSFAQAEVFMGFLDDALGAKGISLTHTISVYPDMDR